VRFPCAKDPRTGVLPGNRPSGRLSSRRTGGPSGGGILKGGGATKLLNTYATLQNLDRSLPKNVHCTTVGVKARAFISRAFSRWGEKAVLRDSRSRSNAGADQ